MIGETISHYKILEKIGEGGMGVVYKAEDTKLKRIVALKFLPSNALGTEEEKARFIREAQAAASLNHPNIATIYEIDEVEGEIFIAMEYIDGQTLKEKINSGPLKIKEAVKIACQVADGLNAAHEKGITHRDIKSANVMLTEKGQAKIMDFGLAKMSARSGLTKAGTTLGTIAYMSPEQSRGETVDHRSDIWSLGVVLYEMVSGQLPFRGEYETAMVYSILNVEPEPLTALRTGVPIALDGIAAKALAKEPDARYQHVDELPVDLKAVDLKSIDTSKILTTTVTERAAPQPSRWRRAVPWSIAALLMVATALVVGLVIWNLKLRLTTTSQSVTRSVITLSPTEQLSPMEYENLLAFSPDGRCLVYVAGDDRQLYLRPMNEFEATPLQGTEGAISPFFSPDGQWVGFFADGKLKKISLEGGRPLTICETNYFVPSATWGPDDTIIFESRSPSLSRVSASGGTPEIITTPDRKKGETWHFFPEMLPDGKEVLFTISRGVNIKDRNIALLNLETGEQRTVLKGGFNGRYAATGHIVFERFGTLMAAPFDLHQHKVTGSPIPIHEGIQRYNWSFSGNGSLVYVPRGESMAKSSLVWVNRQGEAKPLTEERRSYRYPRISPNGTQVAVGIIYENTDIWVYNVESSTSNRLTFGGYNNHPIWTPDGNRLAFSSNRTGPFNLYLQPADGSEEAKQLLAGEYMQKPNSLSPDGKVLAFYEMNPTTQEDIWVFLIQDSSASPFLVTPANEHAPMFSPDGKWLIYMSDESGRHEVYVQPYPSTGAKYQVSTEGGTEPVWSPDGRELFYRSGDKMMAVAVETEPTFRRQGIPQELFEYRSPMNTTAPMYDIHPDGDRFLMVQLEEESTAVNQINVVLNWFEELKSIFNTGNKR